MPFTTSIPCAEVLPSEFVRDHGHDRIGQQSHAIADLVKDACQNVDPFGTRRVDDTGVVDGKLAIDLVWATIDAIKAENKEAISLYVRQMGLFADTACYLLATRYIKVPEELAHAGFDQPIESTRKKFAGKSITDCVFGFRRGGQARTV